MFKDKLVYFDNAATSFPKPPAVLQFMIEFMSLIGANPGRSGHFLSEEALLKMLECRKEVASLFGIRNIMKVIFTSSATEALNTTLFGIIQENDLVLCSSAEHNSVARPLHFLEDKAKIKLQKIKANHFGQIDLNHLEELLKQNPRCCVINHSSNVNGLVQDLQAISDLCKKYHTLLILDASQSAGIIDIDINALGVSVLCSSAHKSLYGPMGLGIMVLSDDFDHSRMKPFKYGGTGSLSESVLQPDFLPDRFESGTPNLPAICGLTEGIKWIREQNEMNTTIENKKRLVNYFHQQATQRLKRYLCYNDFSVVNSGIIAFNLEGIDCSIVSDFLSQFYKICCRTGLHCAPWTHQALNTFPNGTVRFSFSNYNTFDEIEYSISALEDLEKQQ